MKRTGTILMTLLCVVLVAVASVMGTVAYLTDQDSAVNTFTVGKVQIGLDEAKIGEDGKTPIPDEDTTEDPNDYVRTEEGNDYHLIPGQTYVKDPTVTVEAGSEESYVRMIVTINFANELRAIFGDDFLPQNYVEGWNPAVWICKEADPYDNEANTLTYEFRYHEIVSGCDADGNEAEKRLEALFEKFTVPGTVTGTQLATLVKTENGEIVDKFEIKVEGHAIQAAGFTANEEENKTAEDCAWEAFEAQYAGRAATTSVVNENIEEEGPVNNVESSEPSVEGNNA